MYIFNGSEGAQYHKQNVKRWLLLLAGWAIESNSERLRDAMARGRKRGKMDPSLDCYQAGTTNFSLELMLFPQRPDSKPLLLLCQVWGSKWNERAYFSTRKAKIDHSDLCMAVLVQEIIQADYAFVIHTVNPSTEDDTEIYAEVSSTIFREINSYF